MTHSSLNQLQFLWDLPSYLHRDHCFLAIEYYIWISSLNPSYPAYCWLYSSTVSNKYCDQHCVGLYLSRDSSPSALHDLKGEISRLVTQILTTLNLLWWTSAEFSSKFTLFLSMYSIFLSTTPGVMIDDFYLLCKGFPNVQYGYAAYICDFLTNIVGFASAVGLDMPTRVKTSDPTNNIIYLMEKKRK
ncbi:uncharacterized protein N7479_005103 [Penicillium vulpinum]|uniref:uncharacterized protein n=1 Tax=Penicillium vulpinum TaxID=29845 RepID=UPI0025486024|nr:uncharacterized protein N7479_005103 [Penicillium vulpinum]KAJ5965227.1 hypothetical protein N7479_005103 [Penicillium vulpinum]